MIGRCETTSRDVLTARHRRRRNSRNKSVTPCLHFGRCAGTGPGDYHFLVDASGAGNHLKLPIIVTIGQELPAKLKLTTNFPSLRGTATTSFKFRVTVANDSGRDATINFSADAPKNFQVTFTEAYGSQQLTSIPIEAGKSKDIEASVALPRDTPAGDYKLALHAKSEAASADLDLGITVLGQPRLALAGEGGRLSGEAYAGQDGELTVVVRNDGSEAARDVDFSATAPEGWKTSFDPKQLPELAAGKSQTIKVSMTPSPRAIAGDYQTTIRANAADLVLGCRDLRRNPAALPVHARLGNALVVRLLNLLLGTSLHDLPSCKAIRADALLGLEMREMTYGWTVELLVKAARQRLRIDQADIDYRPRRGGRSKVAGDPRASLQAAYKLIACAFRYATTWRAVPAASSRRPWSSASGS